MEDRSFSRTQTVRKNTSLIGGPSNAWSLDNNRVRLNFAMAFPTSHALRCKPLTTSSVIAAADGESSVGSGVAGSLLQSRRWQRAKTLSG
jgi:hypothetical protein